MRHIWPVGRRGWAGYYIRLYNKKPLATTEYLAMLYLLLAEAEEAGDL